METLHNPDFFDVTNFALRTLQTLEYFFETLMVNLLFFGMLTPAKLATDLEENEDKVLSFFSSLTVAGAATVTGTGAEAKENTTGFDVALK